LNAHTSRLRERAHLVDDLLRDGIHVALPIGARDIDLLAYIETDGPSCPIASIPIKIAPSGIADLSNDLETEKSRGLLIAFTPAKGGHSARTLAFTRADLFYIRMVGIMRRVNPALLGEDPDVLATFAMSPGMWRKKIISVLEDTLRG
jgi:hypothetical protein